MKRTVITVDGNGMLSIPSNLEDLWMSENELIDMLYVTTPKLKAVIRAIYKEGMLLMSEVQKRQKLSKDVWQTLYGFPMVVAICFRLTSNGAAQLRDAIFKRLYGANIIRKTKCFDFWERNVLFPKTKRSFFRTPTPLPCPFPLNFSLLIITKKFGNLAKNRYICIV